MIDFIARERLERRTIQVECPDPQLDGPCFVWTGYIKPNGYGTIRYLKQSWYVHRLAYVSFTGPIPEGLDVDHLCRNRACWNPAHLEAVTRQVNVLRGESQLAANARKTRCKWGHEFTPENTYRSAVGRHCKTCRARNERARKARQRQGAAGVAA